MSAHSFAFVGAKWVLWIFPLLKGIGIDDAFLMSAAWHRTNPELRTARRMAEALAEAAVAISITSFTDMVGYGIAGFHTKFAYSPCS